MSQASQSHTFFKKNYSIISGNYRPISLLNIINEIIEKPMYLHVTN